LFVHIWDKAGHMGQGKVKGKGKGKGRDKGDVYLP
jgi:hypothetical protein